MVVRLYVQVVHQNIHHHVHQRKSSEDKNVPLPSIPKEDEEKTN